MDAIIRVVVLVVSLIRSFYDGSTRVYPTDPPTDQPIDNRAKRVGGKKMQQHTAQRIRFHVFVVVL